MHKLIFAYCFKIEKALILSFPADAGAQPAVLPATVRSVPAPPRRGRGALVPPGPETPVVELRTVRHPGGPARPGGALPRRPDEEGAHETEHKQDVLLLGLVDLLLLLRLLLLLLRIFF